MKKLYLTHDVAELVMAFILFQEGVFAIWLIFQTDIVLVRFVLGELALIVFALLINFLFFMSGSRKRREAAQAGQGA